MTKKTIKLTAGEEVLEVYEAIPDGEVKGGLIVL